MKNKNSFSYKQGFKKGIEIYKSNSNKGYYSDSDNDKVMKRCKRYADTGNKNGEPLRDTQIDYYYGMYDGIRYGYKQHGIAIPDKKYSSFEEKENQFCYGKENHYNGFGYYD